MNKLLLSILILVCCFPVFAQEDSTSLRKDSTLFVSGRIDTTAKSIDTLAKVKHNPRKAAIRSAIIPGWGQIYNKKYWKLPLVYGAVGFPTYLFFDNKKWYDRTKFAYAVALSPNPAPDSLAKVHEQLRPFVERKLLSSIINYRNQFRRDMDYSILFFLLAWSLNIVDATVDAHLKEFDVTPDLSLKLKPSIRQGNYGVGLVLDFHKGKPRLNDVR